MNFCEPKFIACSSHSKHTSKTGVSHDGAYCLYICSAPSASRGTSWSPMRPLYDGDDEDVSMINSGWNEELPLRLQPWRHLTRDDAKAIDDSWHSPRVNVFPSPQQVHPRSQAFTAVLSPLPPLRF